MTRRLGLVMMALGAVLTVVGAVGLVTAGDRGATPPEAGQSTSTSATTIGTTAPTASSISTTSTTEAPTTTGASTTSTTAPNPADVEDFVGRFIAWVDESDADSLVERLHPVVIDEYGEDLCRTFVEREILALENYRATGPVTGPDPSQFGSADIDVYRVPVAFTFQGADFTSDAAFAFEDGVVHWFATCR